MTAACSKSKPKQDKAMSGLQTPCIDSGATAHMVIDDTVLIINKKSGK